MSRTVTIPLRSPILDHGGPVREIVLREPTFDEYIEIGDPYEVARSAEGAVFAIQSPEVVRRYLDVCLVKPSNPALLKDAGVGAARKVREAILGFCQDAEEAADGVSPTSPMSSSSADGAISTPAPSVA